MTLYFTRSFSAIVLLTLAMCCGCEHAPSTANGTSSTNGIALPSEKVSLESLLARTDLNDKSRRSLERLSKLGQTEISAETAETIIKNSFLKKEVVVAPKTKLRTDKPSYPQPTLSRNEDPSAAAEIQTKPLLAKDRLEAKHRYFELGVDHFQKRFIYGLPDDVRAESADWMRRVFRQLPVTDCHDQWEAHFRLFYEPLDRN